MAVKFRLPPKGSKCQEASMASITSYIACGRAAKSVVIDRDGVYLNMCLPCAFHSVKNRGAHNATVDEDLSKLKAFEPEAKPIVPAEFDYSADAGAGTDGGLTLVEVKDLAVKLLAAQALVAERQLSLKEASVALAEIEERILPDAFIASGLTDLKLDSGERLKLDYYGSISKETQAAAFPWLRSIGAGDLIKRTVALEFGKGEEGLAVQLLSWVRKQKALAVVPVKDASSVNYNSLSALVRERIASGKQVPDDSGVKVGKYVKVLGAKKKDDL